MKYLYPYECEKLHLSSPQELQAAIDGNRREGRRAGYGYDLSPGPTLIPTSHPHPHFNGLINKTFNGTSSGTFHLFLNYPVDCFLWDIFFTKISRGESLSTFWLMHSLILSQIYIAICWFDHLCGVFKMLLISSPY